LTAKWPLRSNFALRTIQADELPDELEQARLGDLGGGCARGTACPSHRPTSVGGLQRQGLSR
jgi:hypothetical protein